MKELTGGRPYFSRFFVELQREGAVSSIDLFLLGLLEREPQSPYDLAKKIATYELDGVVRLSIPAIYKNVKSLESQNYLQAKTARDGAYPPKTIYSLTPEGRKYFNSLMERYAADKVRYCFDFNSVVINIDMLAPSKRAKMIAQLKEQISQSGGELLNSLRALQRNMPTTAILCRQVELLNRALLTWLSSIEKQSKMQAP